MTGAAMLMVSVVLFNHMELCESIEGVIHYRFKILSCSKCGTFWSALTYLLFTGHNAVTSVAISFMLSYTAIWIELFLGILATRYNELSQVYTTETSDSETGTEASVSEV